MTLRHTLRGVFLYARAAQTAFCVRANRWHYERARDHLSDALRADTHALVDVMIFEAEHYTPKRPIPEWLRRQ